MAADNAGTVVQFTMPDREPPRPAPPEAFAWLDYIHDQHRIGQLLVYRPGSPTEKSKQAAMLALRSAIELAMTENVTMLEMETICSELQLRNVLPQTPTAVAARLMVDILAYGAAKQVRLDVLTKEEIVRLENGPHLRP